MESKDASAAMQMPPEAADTLREEGDNGSCGREMPPEAADTLREEGDNGSCGREMPQDAADTLREEGDNGSCGREGNPACTDGVEGSDNNGAAVAVCSRRMPDLWERSDLSVKTLPGGRLTAGTLLRACGADICRKTPVCKLVALRDCVTCPKPAVGVELLEPPGCLCLTPSDNCSVAELLDVITVWELGCLEITVAGVGELLLRLTSDGELLCRATTVGELLCLTTEDF
jgi:hypothetical protein